MEITFLPKNTSEIHLQNTYRTPTECRQKTSDLPKAKKLPMYLDRAKEKKEKTKQKHRDGTCTSRREL